MKEDIAAKRNLFYSVEETRKKEEYVRSYLRRHPEERGIIYCATRRTADTLRGRLSEEGFPAARYHEGLREQRRRLEQEAFLEGRSRIMIATGAFSMEPGKADVQFVIHYNMPLSLEDYDRETGKADGENERVDCILLFSRQDIAINRMLLRNRRKEELSSGEGQESLSTADESRLQQMTAYCTGKHCYRAFLLDYFGVKHEESCGNCSFCTGSTTPDGWEKEGHRREGERGKSGPKIRPIDELEECRKELFEQLRVLRREIASEKKVPPYIIFSDRTLADMCRKLPRSETELLNVNGVGDYKLEHYGPRFLKILSQYDAA